MLSTLVAIFFKENDVAGSVRSGGWLQEHQIAKASNSAFLANFSIRKSQNNRAKRRLWHPVKSIDQSAVDACVHFGACIVRVYMSIYWISRLSIQLASGCLVSVHFLFDIHRVPLSTNPI